MSDPLWNVYDGKTVCDLPRHKAPPDMTHPDKCAVCREPIIEHRIATIQTVKMADLPVNVQEAIEDMKVEQVPYLTGLPFPVVDRGVKLGNELKLTTGKYGKLVTLINEVWTQAFAAGKREEKANSKDSYAHAVLNLIRSTGLELRDIEYASSNEEGEY
jgi:hypothetical protein